MDWFQRTTTAPEAPETLGTIFGGMSKTRG